MEIIEALKEASNIFTFLYEKNNEHEEKDNDYIDMMFRDNAMHYALEVEAIERAIKEYEARSFMNSVSKARYEMLEILQNENEKLRAKIKELEGKK